MHVASGASYNETRTLRLPHGFARLGVGGIAVNDDGAVTARVGRCGADDYKAILFAAPNASGFKTITSRKIVGDFAEWPVSQSGRVFALCQVLRRTHKKVTSDLTVVDSRDGTVRRARLATKAFERGASGPDCVASDAGTATMMVIQPSKKPRRFTNVGITAGGRGRPRFSLPGGTRDHGIDLQGVSPDGAVVTTEFGLPEATVIHTRTGRHSRAFRPPNRGGSGSSTISPQYGFDGMPEFPWSPFAPAMVVPKGNAVLVFNPRSLKTRKVGRIPSPPRTSGRAYVRSCFLPSGRILFARLPSGGTRPQSGKLFLTDTRRTRLSPLDASALGTISAVSCEAAGSADTVVLATTTGELYTGAADALDGSKLTVP